MSSNTWEVITFDESGLKIEDGDRGKNYPNKAELLRSGYCPFLNNKNIVGDKLNIEDVDYITKEKDDLLRKGKAYIGDIILTTRGSVGNVALFDKSIGCEFVRINSGMVIIRNNGKFDLKYLYQLLKSPYMKDQYKNMSTGSAQPQLPIRDIKKLKLLIPPLNEQKAIAKILSDLDEKIEINNKINDNLEKMAQAIFKQWFVDFEFPNENGEPYKSSGGEMIESELGEIPKGWTISKLGELGNVITGKTPSIKDVENYGDEYKFITPVDIKNECFVIESQRKLSTIGYEKVKKFIIEENSVGVTCIGSNLGEVYINASECFTNQQINSLVLNDKEHYPYVYIILKNMKNDFLNIAGGSAVPIINKSAFSEIKILLPSHNILDQFSKNVIEMFNKIKENLKENEVLKALRDTLLPKLMSGEIRLPLEEN